MSYGRIIDDLFAKGIVPALDAGNPGKDALRLGDELTLDAMFEGSAIANRHMASCCLSGLLLYFDLLDASHNISQNIKTKEGSYWHGIMHRKEGDYWNANYWFDRVGEHPVFSVLGAAALRLADELSLSEVKKIFKKGFKPEDFTSLVEQAVDGNSDLEEFCLRLQDVEMKELFDYCYQRVV